MRPSSIALTVLFTASLLGCDEPIRCGIFTWDPDRNRCVCPADTVELDDGSCMLADGGVVFPPGTEADAGADAGSNADDSGSNADDSGSNADDAGTSLDAAGPNDAETSLDAGLTDAGPDASPPDDACTVRTFYADRDGDGFGDPAAPTTVCAAPAGLVENADDCDDDCITCHPGGTETCNDRDDDCNGIADADEDTLCPFRTACIDSRCSAIPILDWNVQISPRAGASVGTVLVDGSDITGDVWVLVSYTGAIDIGAAARFNPTPGVHQIAILRFASGGTYMGAVHIASGAVSATALEVDEVGNAYVLGGVHGNGEVLGRALAEAGGSSFVAKVTPAGTGWVQRYPPLTLANIALRPDGFVSCATFTGTATVGAETLTSTGINDAVLVLARTDGSIRSVLQVSGPAQIECGGIAHRSGVTIASGTYRGGVALVGAWSLGEPASDDVWVASFDDAAIVGWTATGGGEAYDAGRAVTISRSGAFVSATSMYGASFGGSVPFDGSGLALVRYSDTGVARPYITAFAGDDEQPPLSSMDAASIGAGSPVLGATLRRQFFDSTIDFGSTGAESSGESDVVLLGYSADGSTPRWFHHLGGPGGEELGSIARVGPAHLAAAGLFDSTIALAPTVSLTAASGTFNGFVAVYRVR